LRIAVVHGYYSNRLPSGENVVVDLQAEALRQAGHDVRVMAKYQEHEEEASFYPARAALRVATNRGASPVREIDEFNPDIVHVHNLFPNFGRTWTRRYASRLVATLHNYRPICSAATLFRDGAPCTLCPDQHTSRHAVRYGCFRDSRVATVPLSLGMKFERDPLLASAARIITLNDDMRQHYAAVGVAPNKLVTVPNFVPPAARLGDHRGDEHGDYWLFVGRLSHDKGILPLVSSWPNGPRLKVVGSGPLDEEVTRAAGPTVEMVGQRPYTEVQAMLGAARGLFFPSLWPEGLPTIYLEAMAAGLPVVAWPPSIVGQLVAQDETGFVTSGSVADDIARADAEFPDLSVHCREVFERRYTEKAWVGAVESVYADVVDGVVEPPAAS
jgi:glycosyltransferase involved in cell wall biosynthesis